MKTEKIIRGSITHVLNFTVMELMRYGFKLAMKKELSELNDLIDTDSTKWMRAEVGDLICIDEDLELLESVDDAGVKQLLVMIERILETGHTYQIMGNLDLEEVLTDQDICVEAHGIFSTYLIEIENEGTYEGIIHSLYMFFCSIDMLLFYCVAQLELNKLDVYDEAQQLSYDHAFTPGFEFDPQQSASVLLMELREELNSDANKFTKLLKSTRDQGDTM
ncbi:MAG: hypothetical protein V4594_03460 [Bacteroidota bacterium]